MRGNPKLGGAANQSERTGGPSSGSRVPSLFLLPGAGGQEDFTFEELLRLLVRTVGIRIDLVPAPPSAYYALPRLMSLLLRGVELTRDGLTA